MAQSIDWTNHESFPEENEAIVLCRGSQMETVTLEACPMDGMVWKDKSYLSLEIKDGDLWEYAARIKAFMLRKVKG